MRSPYMFDHQRTKRIGLSESLKHLIKPKHLKHRRELKLEPDAK